MVSKGFRFVYEEFAYLILFWGWVGTFLLGGFIGGQMYGEQGAPLGIIVGMVFGFLCLLTLAKVVMRHRN